MIPFTESSYYGGSNEKGYRSNLINYVKPITTT